MSKLKSASAWLFGSWLLSLAVVAFSTSPSLAVAVALAAVAIAAVAGLVAAARVAGWLLARAPELPYQRAESCGGCGGLGHDKGSGGDCWRCAGSGRVVPASAFSGYPRAEVPSRSAELDYSVIALLESQCELEPWWLVPPPGGDSPAGKKLTAHGERVPAAEPAGARRYPVVSSPGEELEPANVRRYPITITGQAYDYDRVAALWSPISIDYEEAKRLLRARYTQAVLSVYADVAKKMESR